MVRTIPYIMRRKSKKRRSCEPAGIPVPTKNNIKPKSRIVSV